jgi:H+/gluconate symporter-like permease
MSEEQKLIYYKILYKTFEFMKKDSNKDDPELFNSVKSIIIPKIIMIIVNITNA